MPVTPLKHKKFVRMRSMTSVLALMAGFLAGYNFDRVESSQASPQSARVTQGTAVVAGLGSNNITVTQTSSRALVEWGGFALNNGDQISFTTPGLSSVTLNKTQQSGVPNIAGAVTSNGRALFFNADGILFDVNNAEDAVSTLYTAQRRGLLPGLSNTYNNRAMRKLKYGASTASAVVMGLSGFIAPAARYSGIILADMSKASVEAGGGIQLDLYGDGLVSFAVPPDGANSVKEGQKKEMVLTPDEARKIINQTVHIEGSGAAEKVEQRDGKIILSGPKEIEPKPQPDDEPDH